MHGLPTTPVHDLKVHPRDRELIAGTHGRSIWIVDVAPLQQYRQELVAAAQPVLLQPKPALAYRDALSRSEGLGHKYFQAYGPRFGAEITYWVPRGAAVTAPAAVAEERSTNGSEARQGRQRDGVQIIVLNASGDTVRTLSGGASRGLQRVYWNLEPRPEPRVLSPTERRDSAALEPRIAFVADSLVQAGYKREAVDRAITQWRENQRAGFSGFGGGSEQPASGGPLSGALNDVADRPGETKPRAPQGATGDAPETRDLAALLRLTDRPNLRSGSFGSSPDLVDAGTYTIVLKYRDHTTTQKLQVVE